LVGFLGQVGFENVSTLHGDSIDTLSPSGKSFDGARTSTALVDESTIDMFYAKQEKEVDGANMWRYQEIWRQSSYARAPGAVVTEKITDGSAPFIFHDDGAYYLYFHRNVDGIHHIVVRTSGTLDELAWAKETILERREHTLSMPSVIRLRDTFWMTCEELVDGKWQTILLSSKSPQNSFRNTGIVLLQYPCAYQHVIDGKVVVTYSKKTKEGWELWAAESEE